jgi:hypothetical protein
VPGPVEASSDPATVKGLLASSARPLTCLTAQPVEETTRNGSLITIPISSALEPGRWYLYVNYLIHEGEHSQPMDIERCDGFGSCAGLVHTADGALGPVELLVE